jgi:small-conductance mechanosensitive channel
LKARLTRRGRVTGSRGRGSRAPCVVAQGVGGLTFDRCHFNVFADSGLKFELVFYVEAPEYNTYMDILQKFNLAFKEAMENRGVGFAFPTRTIHLLAENAAPTPAPEK